MKLYVASLYQIATGEITLVGVYSNSALAIRAGSDAIADFSQNVPLLLDWDYEAPEETRYYEGFTLYITEAALDQAI